MQVKCISYPIGSYDLWIISRTWENCDSVEDQTLFSDNYSYCEVILSWKILILYRAMTLIAIGGNLVQLWVQVVVEVLHACTKLGVLVFITTSMGSRKSCCLNCLAGTWFHIYVPFQVQQKENFHQRRRNQVKMKEGKAVKSKAISIPLLENL